MDRIKESFDSLPIAACFFDKNGVVRLINCSASCSRRPQMCAVWIRTFGSTAFRTGRRCVLRRSRL